MIKKDKKYWDDFLDIRGRFGKVFIPSGNHTFFFRFVNPKNEAENARKVEIQTTALQKNPKNNLITISNFSRQNLQLNTKPGFQQNSKSTNLEQMMIKVI